MQSRLAIPAVWKVLVPIDDFMVNVNGDDNVDAMTLVVDGVSVSFVETAVIPVFV